MLPSTANADVPEDASVGLLSAILVAADALSVPSAINAKQIVTFRKFIVINFMMFVKIVDFFCFSTMQSYI